MSASGQFINYQSIAALERVGIAEPTEQQINSIEQCLAEAIQLMGMGVFLLNQSGNKNPSLYQARKVIYSLYKLIEENNPGSCA